MFMLGNVAIVARTYCLCLCLCLCHKPFPCTCSAESQKVVWSDSVFPMSTFPTDSALQRGYSQGFGIGEWWSAVLCSVELL